MDSIEGLRYATVILLAFIIIKLIIDVHSIKVYRFYRDGCGFCIQSKNDWITFKKKCVFKLVKCYDIDLDEKRNQALCDNFEVKGVPMIVKVYPDGKRYVYDGDRSCDDMIAWLHSM